MKRLAAASLVLLLLYHTVGQALTFWVAEWQEDQQLAQNLSVYHSTDDLIEFEIPVPLHQYGATSTEVNGGGEFEYDGKFYNIARQELRNDTLHLFCYQDSDELQRHTDLHDFIQKNLTGDDQNAPGKSGHPTKITTPDYAQRTGGHLIFVYEDCRINRPLSPSLSYASVLLFTQSPPPRLRA
ncbi:MAG: hypothetical protein H7Y12_13520 [Sphingobacteriaceae bacterium]|nr:hypothetical protein [Cytophagaceae bacterium]